MTNTMVTEKMVEADKLAAIKEAMTKAVWDALETGGIELLKATSMFLSNRTAALEQEQEAVGCGVEPVAWRWRDNEHQTWNFIDFNPVHMDYVHVEPLYAAPTSVAPAEVRLTADEIAEAKRRKYAWAFNDTEVIAEARELLNELDTFNSMDFDSDAEVACQRSHGIISSLVERLEALSTFEAERARLWNECRDLRATIDVQKAVVDTAAQERDKALTRLQSSQARVRKLSAPLKRTK